MSVERKAGKFRNIEFLFNNKKQLNYFRCYLAVLLLSGISTITHSIHNRVCGTEICARCCRSRKLQFNQDQVLHAELTQVIANTFWGFTVRR